MIPNFLSLETKVKYFRSKKFIFSFLKKRRFSSIKLAKVVPQLGQKQKINVMKCLKYKFLIAAICTTVWGFAQTADSMRKWDIQDCFKYATAHNIQINSLRLSAETSQQELLIAKGNKFPSLYGLATNSFRNSKNDPTGNGNLVNQFVTNGSYTLNSSVILWNYNYINHNIQQRALYLQSAGLSINQTQNNITLQITQAYLNILLSEENQKYIADLVTTSEAKVKQGQLLFDAGSTAKLNLLQLQAQLASDKYLLVQSQNTIKQNMLALKQLLQLPTDTLFDIVIPITLKVKKKLLPIQQVQQTANQIFPEIKIAQLGIDIAELDISKSKAGFKPTLSANGTIGTGYNDVISHAYYAKTEFFTQTNNNLYEGIDLNLSIPIFSNWLHKANLEKSKIGLKQSSLNAENSQLVLSQAVEQAYLNTSNAIEAFDAADVTLKAVNESFRIINEEFKLGAINAFDVLQQRNQYIQAVEAFTQAKYTAILQEKIYEFYAGNPITL